jgi:hypothetical protein
LPAAGAGHANAPLQPASVPVPMQVVTPVVGSVSAIVEPGSHSVGGNIGTH